MPVIAGPYLVDVFWFSVNPPLVSLSQFKAPGYLQCMLLSLLSAALKVLHSLDVTADFNFCHLNMLTTCLASLQDKTHNT